MITVSFNRSRFSGNLLILGAIGLGMCVYVLICSLVIGEPSAMQLIVPWLLYGLVPWVVLLPALMPLLRRIVDAPTLRARILFGLVTVVVLALLHVVLIASILYAAEINLEGRLWQRTGSILGQSGILVFDVLVCVVLAGGASMKNLQQQLRQKDEDAYRLGRNLSDSKMQSLAMQLNPHFLFNTLNGLAVLIDKQENAAARDMVGELSGFLRSVLRSHREKWVTLEEELEFIRQYLRIEQYRFGARLVCFEDCEPLALTARIPPMLLQPLFENAIVHGLADKQGECRLGFECRLYDRHLILMVFDNGEGFDATQQPSSKSGIGLANVRVRLREVYGENFSLDIEKKPDGTLVTLKLPAFKDSQF